jgi:hypothetical protein
MDGVSENVAHPAHVECAKALLPNVEKYLVFDYKVSKAVI